MPTITIDGRACEFEKGQNVLQVALDNDLEIVPVINKIDLPGADPDRVIEQIEDSIGLDASGAMMCSAKTGQGVEELLDAICERFPPPTGEIEAPLQALIFDAKYDDYRGPAAA